MRGLRAELIKLGHRPAIWVISGIALASLVLVIYLALYIAAHGTGGDVPPEEASVLSQRLYPARFLDSVLSNMNQLFHVLAIVLGALSSGSEYGWGTWKTILTQGPSRIHVMASKLVALTIVVTTLTLALFGSAAISSYVAASIDGQTAAWPTPLEMVQGISGGVLVMILWAFFGAVLSTLLRQSAVALGLGITYVIAEMLSSSILSGLSAAKEVFRALPGVNATALLRAVSTNPNLVMVQEIKGTHAASVVALYILAMGFVAMWLADRRDVT